MEYGSIEREIHIEASPEVVFEVLSRPEHVREWWSDEAEFATEPGGEGRLGFGDARQGDMTWQAFSVVEAEPPHRFAFRWTHDDGAAPTQQNSFLVVFTLERVGEGTLLRMTESGFRERGWDEAKAALEHSEHVTGWDYYLPRLVSYAAEVGAQA
ncbi:SRPBCC domain-containing protein [Mumia quercus]|uniref:SRPBCC domain-containing protein n=1 Tax=Mumia quercus TaxID=2976125 RepID=UPI0021D2AEE9|nr:SRPBCC domain-containing protein [Mumia quercus]